ncbi:MAG: rod shape-determining protein MreD [Pseudomonadota bacterium]
MSRRKHQPLAVLASILVAAALTIVPLGETLAWFRPYWMALVIIYWGIESPREGGLATAFFAGLLLDVLTGTLLGQHALSLVIVAYIVARFRLRIRFFPLWQQALVVLAILLNDRIIEIWILGLSGRPVPGWQALWPPLTAMLAWPWVFLLLDEARRRTR